MNDIGHTGQVRGIDILAILSFPVHRLDTSFQDFIKTKIYTLVENVHNGHTFEKENKTFVLFSFAIFIAFLIAVRNISEK